MGQPTSYIQTSFYGGEISQAAQGRVDLPAYKISMNVCLNYIPTETGALLRRPGTRHAAVTRGGAHGRGISFAFTEASPYVMQLTDGIMRFTTGPALVMTNDQQAVSSISAANPAVVTTAKAHGWANGNTVLFNSLGVNNPRLQNRQVVITVTGAQTFSIADAITGASINGSTLGSFVSGNVTRVLEIATTWANGSWSSLRSVQAEERTMLLNGTRPQVLQVATQPTATQFATFTFGPANFIDGPYLDPIAGSVVSSSALNGVVTLTFSFTAYDATVAYNVGDFAEFSGIGYQSLIPLNQNNEPDISPADWTPVNGGAPINGGLGFVASDIGRLVRLLSEPPLWSAASNYSTGNVVAYPDGLGGTSYWTATGSITGGAAGTQPGTSTLWALNATGSIWTWAQIVSVSGSGLISPSAAIGSLSSPAAAIDGNTSKAFASCANADVGIVTYPIWTPGSWAVNTQCQSNGFGYQANLQIWASGPWPAWASNVVYSNQGTVVVYNGLVYTMFATITAPVNVPPPSAPAYWALNGAISTTPPASAPSLWTLLGPMSQPTEDFFIGQQHGSPVAVQSARLYPSSDLGLVNIALVTINLRASNSPPASPSAGTLLGTTGPVANQSTAYTILSSDSVSTWTNMWFEIIGIMLQPLPDNGSHVFGATFGVSQVQFYSPSVNNGSVITAQIRGPALLYNQPIRTWQAGVYSDTTGWPTCGTYLQGRIWLGGVISNRFDASVSNGLNGTQLNFAPTAHDGTVSANNSISYICDGEDSNQILWMASDQQGVILGTQAGEWLVSAPAAGPLAPANIQAVRVTKIGCANIEPRRAEHTLLIVHKFERKIVEYFADVFSGKFTAPNLAERAKHLTVTGIAEIAYQQELAPVVWARRNDGTLIGATYKRDTLMTSQGPTIIGWHRHLLGSGRAVESLCVGPSVGGNLDAMSLVTNDTGTGVRHIEVGTDLLDEGFALTDCWFLDDGIVPSSTLVQAAPTGGAYGSLLVNGLWPHNGKTVSAFIAGLDCGDYVVSNGSITVPFGDGISGGTANGLFTGGLVESFTTLPAVIGFTYNSDGQLVRPVAPAEVGTQAGPGWAKFGRLHRGAAQFTGMVNGSILFGTDFSAQLDPVKLRFPNDVPYTLQQQWSGIWRDNVFSKYDFDNMLCWRISRPWPGYISAAGGFDTKADA